MTFSFFFWARYQVRTITEAMPQLLYEVQEGLQAGRGQLSAQHDHIRQVWTPSHRCASKTKAPASRGFLMPLVYRPANEGAQDRGGTVRKHHKLLRVDRVDDARRASVQGKLGPPGTVNMVRARKLTGAGANGTTGIFGQVDIAVPIGKRPAHSVCVRGKSGSDRA